jgi:hypothetical protein
VILNCIAEDSSTSRTLSVVLYVPGFQVTNASPRFSAICPPKTIPFSSGTALLMPLHQLPTYHLGEWLNLFQPGVHFNQCWTWCRSFPAAGGWPATLSKRGEQTPELFSTVINYTSEEESFASDSCFNKLRRRSGGTIVPCITPWVTFTSNTYQITNSLQVLKANTAPNSSVFSELF